MDGHGAADATTGAVESYAGSCWAGKWARAPGFAALGLTDYRIHTAHRRRFRLFHVSRQPIGQPCATDTDPPGAASAAGALLIPSAIPIGGASAKCYTFVRGQRTGARCEHAMKFAAILEQLPRLSAGEREEVIRQALVIGDDSLSAQDEATIDRRLAEHRGDPGSALSLEQLRTNLAGRRSR